MQSFFITNISLDNCRTMEDTDYREALAEARKQAANNQPDVQKENHTLTEIVCGDVLVAEQYIRQQENEWEIASLAREMLLHAHTLKQRKHDLETLHAAALRMAEAVQRHPRLQLELLQFAQALNQAASCDTKTADNIEARISALQHNIALADEGRLQDIEPPRQTLRRDPVEWTRQWEEVIDEANRKVAACLADTPRGMGFCHAYWHELARVLHNDYGIAWSSPAVLNPRVMFD